MPVDETTPEKFTISLRGNGSLLVLAVSGDLDLNTAPALEKSISDSVNQTSTGLIVDLSGVSFLASAAMTVLAMTQRKYGKDLAYAVVADGPATSRPLRLMGLDQTFALYEDLATAVSAIESAG